MALLGELQLNELLAVAVFMAVILSIIFRIVDETAAALAGLIILIIITGYTAEEAFRFIDWNVIFILLGMWVITGYMIEAGLPEMIIRVASRRVRGYRSFLIVMSVVSGFLSLFVDNVLVILILGSIVVEAARRSGANPVLAVLLIGFSANFMGTALLMGDLPPQLLHSVAGAEFLDFIWFRGKPSSFPLLTITFFITLGIMYVVFVRRERGSIDRVSEGLEDVKAAYTMEKKVLLALSIAFFVATVAGMAARPLLGVKLGFITMSGAALLALTVELLRRTRKFKGLPAFERVFQDRIEWRALTFYAALFALVGGLEYEGILERIARTLIPVLSDSTIVSYTVFYWVVGVLSLFMEHDALLLAFLYVVREASELAGVDPWPLYWGMAWSATLASNATTAAAPALYVAVTIAEKAGYRVRASEFLRYSLVYALSSLTIHYLITLPIWGI